MASLDLGGESTQIAFLKPSSNNKVGHKIDIDHDIYKRSYLFYGAKESMNRYELYISMKSTYSNRTVDSPCFNVGYQGHHQLLEGVTFMGTGDVWSYIWCRRSSLINVLVSCPIWFVETPNVNLNVCDVLFSDLYRLFFMEWWIHSFWWWIHWYVHVLLYIGLFAFLSSWLPLPFFNCSGHLWLWKGVLFHELWVSIFIFVPWYVVMSSVSLARNTSTQTISRWFSAVSMYEIFSLV